MLKDSVGWKFGQGTVRGEFIYNPHQRLANVFLKGQIANILGFPNPMGIITTTQLCNHSMKTAIDNT